MPVALDRQLVEVHGLEQVAHDAAAAGVQLPELEMRLAVVARGGGAQQLQRVAHADLGADPAQVAHPCRPGAINKRTTLCS